jgi:hypothetical protein
MTPCRDNRATSMTAAGDRDLAADGCEDQSNFITQSNQDRDCDD